MQKRFSFDYDPENDDLFMYDPKSKSASSVEFGDLVYDYDTNKELVGIEIMNASRLFADLLTGKSLKDIRSILSTLTECKVEIKIQKSHLMIIRMDLSGKIKDTTEVISPVLSSTAMMPKSPALSV